MLQEPSTRNNNTYKAHEQGSFEMAQEEERPNITEKGKGKEPVGKDVDGVNGTKEVQKDKDGKIIDMPGTTDR